MAPDPYRHQSGLPRATLVGQWTWQPSSLSSSSPYAASRSKPSSCSPRWGPLSLASRRCWKVAPAKDPGRDPWWRLPHRAYWPDVRARSSSTIRQDWQRRGASSPMPWPSTPAVPSASLARAVCAGVAIVGAADDGPCSRQSSRTPVAETIRLSQLRRGPGDPPQRSPRRAGRRPL
jgi:hypothetical protein